MTDNATNATNATIWCADVSLAVGEQLFATATRADVWIALEYNQPWAADALAGSDLPDAVKEHLQAATRQIPQSRLQLIRTDEAHAGLMLYIGVVSAGQSALYAYTLQRYEDVLDLDLAQIAAGAQPTHRQTTPIVLICTNGKRDICCAKHGLVAFKAMQATALAQGLPLSVWQSNHIGGHRFAGTAVALPSGTCYGRMTTPASAEQVFADLVSGRIPLAYWRGQCGYDEPVQAAEYFLRTTSAQDKAQDESLMTDQAPIDMTLLSAVNFIGSQILDQNQWQVQFDLNGKVVAVQVRADPSTFLTYKSSTDASGVVVPQYSRLQVIPISDTGL
jgi:hypothetical protein